MRGQMLLSNPVFEVTILETRMRLDYMARMGSLTLPPTSIVQPNGNTRRES